MKQKIVIKIGGSLLFTQDNKINFKKIEDFCNVLKNDIKFDKIILVCGGGAIARDYINAVRKFTGNEALCDIFGIEISRINAKLLITFLNDNVYPLVPKSIEDLTIALISKDIIVMGGLQPGQSTTSVALEVAEYIKADELLILTDVEGIYDKDPKKFKDAKLFHHLNYQQLQEIIMNSTGDKQAAAGEYRIFDAVSLQILKRSKIKIFLTSGIDFDILKNYCNHKKSVTGTIISEI